MVDQNILPSSGLVRCSNHCPRLHENEDIYKKIITFQDYHFVDSGTVV